MKVFFASFWNTSFLYHFVIILFSSSPFFFWIFLLLLWFLSSSVQFFFICSSLCFHFVLCVFLFSLVFIFRTHVFLDPVSIWFNMFFVFSFFLLSPFASPVSCFFSILDFVSSVWNLPIKTLSCPLLWKNICIFSCPISFIFSLSYFFITFCFHLVFSSPFQFDLFLLSPFPCCFFSIFSFVDFFAHVVLYCLFKKTIFTLSFLITSFFLFFPFFLILSFFLHLVFVNLLFLDLIRLYLLLRLKINFLCPVRFFCRFCLVASASFFLCGEGSRRLTPSPERECTGDLTT